MSYGKISILMNYLPSADTPPIRLWRTSPYAGGRINRSMLSRRDMASLLSIHSAPSKRGKGGGASHQRGNLHRPQGGCMVFRRAKPGCPVFAAKGGIKKMAPIRAPTSPAGMVSQPIGKPFNGQAKGLLWLTWRSYAGPPQYNIPPEGGALNLPVRQSRSQAEPLAPRAVRPGGAINPRGGAASTFGNTASRRIPHKSPSSQMIRTAKKH